MDFGFQQYPECIGGDKGLKKASSGLQLQGECSPQLPHFLMPSSLLAGARVGRSCGRQKER